MIVNIIEEAGYEAAIRGMSYSFRDRSEDLHKWWEAKRYRAMDRAKKLAPKGGGHNDFLKQIMVWLDIEAPRYWWSEMDTYHFAWKNSESTMHTLSKRLTTMDDYEVGTHPAIMTAFNTILATKPSIQVIKANLPEGYLQRRMVTTNYMALKNIIYQRHDHRLPEWQLFCNYIQNNLQHKELINAPN